MKNGIYRFWGTTRLIFDSDCHTFHKMSFLAYDLLSTFFLPRFFLALMLLQKTLTCPKLQLLCKMATKRCMMCLINIRFIELICKYKKSMFVQTWQHFVAGLQTTLHDLPIDDNILEKVSHDINKENYKFQVFFSLWDVWCI